MTRAEIDARDAVGTDVLMWGSDFPHLEGSWPEVQASVRTLLGGVPEPDARAILGLNLARAYGVDLDRLAPVVERIGPAPADLALV
jgi:hypothetical protein